MKKIFALVVLVSIAAVAPVFAEDGPKIDGTTTMNVGAENALNAAVGDNATATQAIGAIEAGDIKGNTTLDVNAANSLNASVGKNSCADQAIGSIGHKSNCK